MATRAFRTDLFALRADLAGILAVCFELIADGRGLMPEIFGLRTDLCWGFTGLMFVLNPVSFENQSFKLM